MNPTTLVSRSFMLLGLALSFYQPIAGLSCVLGQVMLEVLLEFLADHKDARKHDIHMLEHRDIAVTTLTRGLADIRDELKSHKNKITTIENKIGRNS